MAKKKELDITKTGPVGYKSLQDQNNSQFDEIDKFISESQNRILSVASQSDPYRDMRQMVQSPLANTNTAWGESMFDNKTANQADFENLGDVRAYNQPWYAQIGAGLAKGAVLAGTTFLDGTVGLLLGAGTAIKEDRWSGLWDNDFSKAMQSINELSEEVLPNYYTKAEQEQPWYENIFTANFLGDKFIKNLGFTIGAFYSGGLEAASIRGLGKLAMAGAKRLGAGIKTLKNISNTSSIVAAGLGSATSAVNEGRIEALNNSKDWFELHKAQLDDIYSERIRALQDEYEANAGKQLIGSSDGENVSFVDSAYTKLQQAIAKEKEAYNKALGKLTEDRLKMGNADLLMNLPILMASNLIQFGKLYANGFKTAKKAINVVGKPGEYKAGTTKLGAAYNITKGALSEGTEEILQGAASRISGNYYSTDVNNFYKSKTDQEAAQETLSWTKSFAQGINETVNDGSAWEEFFIGSLTGALGMPRFRGIRNAKGKLQSPITLEGGAINEWREYNAKIAREKEIANYMNNRINSPEFKNYYQGLVRHNKYQNDMNRAAEEGNEFDFKNAEHAQLVSDIVMFDQAGKLEDLKSAINEASGTSQEDLESIVVNTTSKDENGDLIGPFSKYASEDDNGNIIANFGTEEDINEMASKINKNKKDIIDTIKKYQGIKDELILKTGQQLSDDQLEELTWMKSQLDDWTKRAVHMSAEVKAAMSFILDNLNSFLRFNQQVRDFEGQSHADLTDRYLQADKNVKAIEGAINTLNMVIHQGDKVLAHTLATNPKFVDGLIKEINEIDETAFSADDKEDIITKLNDIIKLGNASKTYNAKLKEYLENPQKQVEDHARADEQAVQQEKKDKSNSLKESLNSAKNLQEFRVLVDNNIDDIENVNSVLDELESEGSEMAKNYRETSQYNNEVRRVLNESDAEPQVKQDAMKLLQDQFNNSENLEQLANPNSIYINNENAFDEDSEGDVELSATRFQEAQYELQRAMSKVNNDNRFKDRFSPEYKKPVEKREGTVRGDDRTTTGDSGTSTVPSTDGGSTPAATYTPPTGDVTASQVMRENEQLNERTEDSQPLVNVQNDRKLYYRPAIPELHIEASKEGDFRDFSEIAKTELGQFYYIKSKLNDKENNLVDAYIKEHPDEPKNVQLLRKALSSVLVGNEYLESLLSAPIPNFDVIYDHLRDNHAFTYVNEGNLKVGDEIGFMIDPEFEKKVEGKEWHTAPTIFLIDKRNNQVVGSLDESNYSISRYDGLKSLEERIRREYANRQNKTDKFIATPITRVSKIMVGRIPYDNTERSLNDIPNVSSANRKPIFGIIKNGVLTTNGKKDDNLIIKPVDMSNEGRLYLLIPNGAGKYSPAAVRVKHFNRDEFNPEDVNVRSTQVYEDIQEAINALASSTSEDDVKKATSLLASVLYKGNLHVNFFTSNKGDGIRFIKVEKDAQGNEIYEIKNGNRVRKDEEREVFLTEKRDPNVVYSIIGSNDIQTSPALKSVDAIAKEITNILLDFNLPIQVSTDKINTIGYNEKLITSNILTSNITEASVKDTWFTTDYFDNEGNLHKAINPASVAPQPKRKVETPVGGTEGAISGTRIISVLSNKPYYVDLKTNTIRDDQGRTVEVTDDNRILLDLAWAQDNFGDSTNSSMMVDNKVLTPDGKVLDRSKQTYLSGQGAQDVKDIIAGRKKEREDRVAKSKEVISELYENQKRVDKTRTDDEFYYVLEDDGEYHQYSRVHSRLGSNWVESDKQAKTLELARLNLSKFVDNPTQYENYLKYLENKFKVDLTAYRGKTDAKSRDTIVNIVRDKMSGTNSQRALDAGSAVDSIIRQYFTVKDVSKIVRPSNMSENAFVDLITTLNEVKSKMELMGERFLADNIVLFQKYPDGTRVAGEVDILSIDKDGNFRIYDVKTRRYSFYSEGGLNLFDWTINGLKATKEEVQNYINRNFKNPFILHSNMSDKDYYTLQLSAYKNLFESQYGVPITTLAIMPFVLSYDKKNVSAVQSEKGIPITYNPAVNVPLVSAVKVDKPVETPATLAQAQIVLPIFETSLETQSPIEDLTPEHSMNNADEGVGYFELDGKLHKGYITRLTEIDGVGVYITKVPNITKGFGRQGEAAHVASNSFYAVFPNGKTFLFLENNPVQGGMTQSQVENEIRKELEAKPQKVKEFASEKTILFDPDTVPIVSVTPITTVETPATINQGNIQTGAAYTAQKEQAINDHDEEFEDEFTLRKAKDTTETSVWNQEKELKWLNKVLPQLSEQDRVKVVKGLIKVGKRGTLAWGQFDKGIITLSDIAAEGTTYHEAFHVVFNLLLDQNERISLLNEYRSKHPNRDDLSLEEELAEDFREFVMQGGKDTRSLGRKIIDFFKSLFIKTKYWKDFRPSSIYYFIAINEGKYSGKDIPITTLNEAKYKQEEYTQEMQDILAKAPRDSQGRLLAPNGKVSNLTERQYAQVRTKAFKDWFGDWENDPDNASKVVDENGEPLVVYHGTRTGEAIRNEGFSNKMSGKGNRGANNKQFYFTSSYENAEYTGVKVKEIEPLIDIITSVYDLFETSDIPSVNDIYNIIRSNEQKVRELKDNLDKVRNDSPIKKLTNKLFKLFNVNKKDADEIRSEYRKTIDSIEKDINELYRKAKVADFFNRGLEYLSGDKTKTSVNTLKFIKESINSESPYRQKAANKLINILYGTDNLVYSPEVFPVFLNIRTPLTSNFNMKPSDENPLLSGRFSTKLIDYNTKEQKLLEELNNPKYDGSISKNKFDILFSDIYIVKNPNQIKSATENTGTFSTTNNDIRYRVVPNSSFEVLRQEAQSFLDNFDISIKDLDDYDSDVPLFDALNRVINIRSANDITEGVGYAVAFMMQHNPRVNELINFHIQGSNTFKLKGIRRSIRNRGTFSLDLSSRENKEIDRQEAIKQIGADIAVELRKLYNLETPDDIPNSYIKNIWNVIKEFFKKITPRYRTVFNVIANNTKQIAIAIKLNDPSIIVDSLSKPGTNTIAERVDIEKALLDNPYEKGIIETLQNYNIALAGSASIAIEGTLYRPKENPLHDIDFSAMNYNKSQLDEIMNKEFPHNIHIRTIKDGESKATETYLILDRDFYIEKVEGLGLYKLIDKNTKEVLGSYVGSELTLKDGVQGKFLDFFTGKLSYGNKIVSLNGRDYLISDFRNAFEAKVDWARVKDIWDYNRFVSSGKVKSLDKLKEESNRNLKEKLQNARVIWGHPAIGKTTYLERNDDILEWDDLVNEKRNIFLRDQIDPNHTMDIKSSEYKQLRSEYMANWKNHSEYVEFLTREWNNLIARAKRENKRVFASPLPLLEIGRKDIDLIVALNDRDFTERNKQRGGEEYSTRGWKQAIDRELVQQDPSKVVYTEDYFSNFMRKNLGVTWGTLTNEEAEVLLNKGWTAEKFNSISQEERDYAVKCIAF